MKHLSIKWEDELSIIHIKYLRVLWCVFLFITGILSSNPQHNDKVSIVRKVTTHTWNWIKNAWISRKTCYFHKRALAGTPFLFSKFQCVTYFQTAPCLMESSQTFLSWTLSNKIFSQCAILSMHVVSICKYWTSADIMYRTSLWYWYRKVKKWNWKVIYMLNFG